MCQPHTYAADPQTGLARLRRFKWGMYVSSHHNFVFFETRSIDDITPCVSAAVS